ncbi:GGDEF domain-containing protein [Fibrobacter sp.]|uniref:GGDEF domain-containing protein n=1 Tax=Fibrobacter sp. TaxID=35828 RepID=UPI00386596A9
MMMIINVVIANVLKQGKYDSILNLDEGWTLIFHDDTTEIPSIKDFAFEDHSIKRGDSLILRRRLGTDYPENPVLRFETYHAFIEAYRDHDLLYSSGKKDFTEGSVVGSSLHFVYLGVLQYKNRMLELRFHMAEDDAWDVLPIMEVLPARYAYGDFFARHSMSLAVGLFSLLFGALSLFCSLGAFYYGMSFFRILMTGVLSFSLGLWTICYTRLMQIFSLDFSFNTCLEYISLYTAPIPLCLLLLHLHYKKISKARWWGLLCVAAVGVIFLVSTIILNGTHVLRFPRTLWMFHVYAIVGLGYMIFAGILYNRHFDAPGKILSAGVSVFGGFAVIDLVRFNVAKYVHMEHSVLEMTLLPVGTSAFVLLLVLSYLVYVYQLLSEKAEKDALSEMAYKDALTGLYNRAKCLQIFGVLDKGDGDYAIVSIDMNGLKLANDNYGHSTGDKLIKAFADVLKDAFAGIGSIIRVGGDEFLVIVRSEHVCDVEGALSMMAELQKARSVKLPIPLEVAYGIAYRNELLKGASGSGENVRVGTEDVYHLADERMYAMKASMKSNLVRK